jgi:hypothetical protein
VQRKFQAIIFYEDKERLEQYLHAFQFDEPIRKRNINCDKETIYEYEHFEIRCFNKSPSDYFRGWKCDLVAVEESIYNMPEFISVYQNVICGMLVPQRFEIGVQVF